MPHFKCMACRTRLYSAGSPADLVGDVCPTCEAVLEPVGSPTEVIGFRFHARARRDALDDSGSVHAVAVAMPRSPATII